MHKISLVVPVFNEEDVISFFYQAVRDIAHMHNYSFEIVFVNDGSTDKTKEAICKLQKEDPNIILVDLSRNFGKEAALFAGLEYSNGDAVIPLDVDLQDPLEIIPQLVGKWQQGADIVLAKRCDRSTDSYLKRISADIYYKVHNALAEEKIENNVGDFRLLSRKSVERIIALPEKNLFMKGLMHWIGGKTDIVEYKRPVRVAGHSKFNGWRLWNFALQGITSFSTLPLRIWTYIGFLIAGSAFLYGCWIVFSRLVFGNNVAGYASLISVMLFLGGVQLIGIGMLGEYIGRIYTECKSRPRYIVDEVIVSSAATEKNTKLKVVD